MTTPSWMPPLPNRSAWDLSESGVTFDLFTEDQMLAYAEAYRKAWVASLKPVTTVPVLGNLYRLDDQP